MKHMKRSGLYQASNYKVTFNPKSWIATSYSWWVFVRKIKGQVVFNSYRYSVTTAKHQSKVRSLMRELGIKIDREVSFKTSLDKIDSLKELNQTQKLQDEANARLANLKRIERNKRAKERRAEKKALIQSMITNAAHESQTEHMRVLSIVGSV